MPTLDKFLEECSNECKPLLSSKTVEVIIDKKEKERILNELLEETKLHASVDSKER